MLSAPHVQMRANLFEGDLLFQVRFFPRRGGDDQADGLRGPFRDSQGPLFSLALTRGPLGGFPGGLLPSLDAQGVRGRGVVLAGKRHDEVCFF